VPAIVIPTQYILPIEKALQNNCINQFTITKILSEINRVALITATQLEKFYSRSRYIGFDIGLDEKANIWIIEANFKPDIQLFYCLEDKTMYRTILTYLAE
jgi:Tubulin-tyrosine ligase family.